MIEFISGKLIKKYPNYVIVDNNGLGYKVNITLNTYNTLPELSNDIYSIHFLMLLKIHKIYMDLMIV